MPNDASEHALGNIVYTPFNMDIAYVSARFFAGCCRRLRHRRANSSFCSFYCFQWELRCCVLRCRKFIIDLDGIRYFSIKWLQLQRHRHKTLQDVVLMTFVIWNSYVLLAGWGERRRRWKFSLCAWTVCILQIFSCSSSDLFTNSEILFSLSSTADRRLIKKREILFT